MMEWYGDGMDTGSWVIMIAAMVIFWGLVVLGGVLLFRGSVASRHRGDTQDRGALDILEERFARGEVDREEYEARAAVLGKEGGPGATRR